MPGISRCIQQTSPPVSVGFCLVKVGRGLLPFVVGRCSLSLVVGRCSLSFVAVVAAIEHLVATADTEQHEERCEDTEQQEKQCNEQVDAIADAEQDEEQCDEDAGGNGRTMKRGNTFGVGIRNPVSRNKDSHPSEFVNGFVNMSAIWYFVFTYRS